ncbi:hypothetical protein BP5796_02499 [Coleophoma crateriformis]|uniref:Uncharacterized protein n=1 Tax=Coleophoma crateriformis TaxID=565419 RepID=A0A3D8SYH1_9HELO|nr:hypothetical protein BP5796_02499 [Coleophoma crateriformis]
MQFKKKSKLPLATAMASDANTSALIDKSQPPLTGKRDESTLAPLFRNQGNTAHSNLPAKNTFNANKQFENDDEEIAESESALLANSDMSVLQEVRGNRMSQTASSRLVPKLGVMESPANFSLHRSFKESDMPATGSLDGLPRSRNLDSPRTPLRTPQQLNMNSLESSHTPSARSSEFSFSISQSKSRPTPQPRSAHKVGQLSSNSFMAVSPNGPEQAEKEQSAQAQPEQEHPVMSGALPPTISTGTHDSRMSNNADAQFGETVPIVATAPNTIADAGPQTTAKKPDAGDSINAAILKLHKANAEMAEAKRLNPIKTAQKPPRSHNLGRKIKENTGRCVSKFKGVFSTTGEVEPKNHGDHSDIQKLSEISSPERYLNEGDNLKREKIKSLTGDGNIRRKPVADDGRSLRSKKSEPNLGSRFRNPSVSKDMPFNQHRNRSLDRAIGSAEDVPATPRVPSMYRKVQKEGSFKPKNYKELQGVHGSDAAVFANQARGNIRIGPKMEQQETTHPEQTTAKSTLSPPLDSDEQFVQQQGEDYCFEDISSLQHSPTRASTPRKDIGTMSRSDAINSLSSLLSPGSSTPHLPASLLRHGNGLAQSSAVNATSGSVLNPTLRDGGARNHVGVETNHEKVMDSERGVSRKRHAPIYIPTDDQHSRDWLRCEMNVLQTSAQ